MMRRTAAFLLAALLTTIGTAMAQAPEDGSEIGAAPGPTIASVWQDFEPRFRQTVCPFATPATFDPDIVQCGDVLVPEDRTNPDSRLIKLSVMKVSATSDTPPAGAVVRLEGGPGGPGVNPFRAAYYSGPGGVPFREVSDIIFFDQRGMGYSEPSFCRAIPWGYQQGLDSLEEGAAAHRAEMRTCIAEARQRGIPVEAYTNWQNALDVRDLRRAFGYETWNIFGISYGTLLGQGILQVDGDHIRAAVLDGVVGSGPGDAMQKETMVLGLQNSLETIEAACPDGAPCQDRLSGLVDRVVALADSYEADPVILEGLPRTVASDGRMVLDGNLVTGLFFQLLYSQGLYSDIPVVLDVAERRDIAALKAYAEAVGTPIDHSFGVGAGWLISCQVVQPSADAFAASAAEAPGLARYFDGFFSYLPCDDVIDGEPDPTSIPTVSDVPMLVTSGAADPVTAPWNAEAILPGLSNAQHIVFPYGGHGALLGSGPCGRNIYLAFLKAPEAELDTSCIADMPAPDYLTSWRATKGAYHMLRGVQAGQMPVGLIVIAALLALSALLYPAFAAARLVDRRVLAERRGAAGAGRWFSWGGAVLGLAALSWAGWMIMGWAGAHMLAVPVGLPGSIALPGWLSLLALGLACFGLYQSVRALAAKTTPIASFAASLVTALACAALVWSMISIGAGPV